MIRIPTTGPQRILVCGSRHWIDRAAIRSVLEEIATWAPHAVVIHGDCGTYCKGVLHGADKIAGDVARELGLAVEAFPADWEFYGRAAGPIRNQKMLDEGQPTCVVAFHENIAESRGTRDMLQRAVAAGLPYMVVGDTSGWQPRRAEPEPAGLFALPKVLREKGR